jgi:hypothetical protein
MDLLNALMDSAGRDGLARLGGQVGLPADQTQQVLRQVLPALGQGLKRNISQSGGLESLARGLQTGNHQRYLDDATALADPAARDDGNAILGHIFGSKDVSRNVAAQAASQTGVDADVIKQLLPMVAAMAMGALSKQTAGGQQLPGGDLLGSLLGGGKDGLGLDDVLNMARKFF